MEVGPSFEIECDRYLHVNRPHFYPLRVELQSKKKVVTLKPESVESILSLDDSEFKATVVRLILDRNTEKAVELLSRKFKLRTPKLEIGHTKGKKIALAVYSVPANSISFADQEYFFNPFVVLHEMYHCIRSTSGHHRGTEKNADRFALNYIENYRRIETASSFDFNSIPTGVD